MKYKYNLRKKLTITVIFLFIGVAFAPSINANVSKQDELVEFDVEFCGLGKKHTVKLTQQEADEVELLFDDIEQRLSEIETRAEAEEIFKDAIVELDKYGLLSGLSIRQAQRLVVGEYQKSKIGKLLEKLYCKDEEINNGNFLCLVAGDIRNAYSCGPLISIGLFLSYLPIHFFFTLAFSDFLDSHPLFFLFMLTIGVQIILFASVLEYGLTLMSMFENSNPFPIVYRIGLGSRGDGPANGWLFTIGLTGIKQWNDSFYGNLFVSPIIVGSLFDYFWWDFYTGIAGFTGLKISKGITSGYYLGSALRVRVGPEPIEWPII